MAGIYIHIPFCKTRCSYCDFHKETKLAEMPQLVDGIINELILRKDYLEDVPLKTIYFGGGTPSVIGIELLQKILATIFYHFTVREDAEITIEANPDDLDETYARGLESTRVNRLSMGVQSFSNDDLKLLNRRHDALQAEDAVQLALSHGISNISIDLIYGLPSQTLEQWHHNLEKALSLPVTHLSCYHLIYEKGTPLFSWRENRKVIPVSEDVSLDMFKYLIKRAEEAGFEHYEVSNFAKNGCRSQHNSAYWQGESYLGIGPSAHSYNGKERSWNISDNARYMHALRDKHLIFEKEVLDLPTRYNDYVVTALRTKEGIDLEKVESLFGADLRSYCLKFAAPYLKTEKLMLEGACLSLSREGIFVSDGIMSELLWVD